MDAKIINPDTGRLVSIFGKIGKRIINKYIQSGGTLKKTMRLQIRWDKRKHPDKYFNISINSDQKIIDIKHKVAESEHIDSEQISLIKYGKILEDTKTCEDYDIVNGDTLHMHVRNISSRKTIYIKWIQSDIEKMIDIKINSREYILDIKRYVANKLELRLEHIELYLDDLHLDNAMQISDYSIYDQSILRMMYTFTDDIECNLRHIDKEPFCCEKYPCSDTSKCMFLPDQSICIERKKRETWLNKYHIPKFTKILSTKSNIIYNINQIKHHIELLETKKHRLEWWNNKPSAYFAVLAHGSYRMNDFREIESSFVVPNGIKIVLLGETDEAVMSKMENMLKDADFMNESCIHNHQRTIAPACLISQQDIAHEYNICEICKSMIDYNDRASICSSCNYILKYKYFDRKPIGQQTDDCVFSIYNSGSICANLILWWKAYNYASIKKQAYYEKIGIYKLPSQELMIDLVVDNPRRDTKNNLETDFPDWEKYSSFNGSVMPMDMPILDKYGSRNKAKLEGINYAEEKYIPETMSDNPVRIWEKYGNQLCSLHQLIYHLPRGTISHPIVYFISSCRVGDKTSVDLARQFSSQNRRGLIRLLSDK